MAKKNRKHPLKMLHRMAWLFLFEPNHTNDLVSKSYNRISAAYDQVWTDHMSTLTASLIDRLNPKDSAKAIDLTCGTGFATHLIAGKTNTKVIGVDKSEGMLSIARENYSGSCDFVNADILEYLRQQPAASVDLITSCWGLGYSKPLAVLRQISRVLRPGGSVAIIDNSLFSLREIIYCSFLTFMEQPEKLANLMRFRFLATSHHLGFVFRRLGLKPSYLTAGRKSYKVKSGNEAIERLRATGAAAGFEYACHPRDQQRVFQRFAEIIEQKYLKEDGIKITHRYLAGIAHK